MAFSITLRESFIYMADMDKKYFTSKLFLVSGITLLVSGIIMFCYPFLFPDLDQLLFKLIFGALGLVSVGGTCWFFRAFCFYPVFTKDSIVMRNAVIPSRTRTVKYGEINYATVNKRETGKGHVILQLHIGLKDGENLGYSLMTDARQLEELRDELAAHGVTEDPVSDAVIKRSGDMVYISKGIVALFIGLILFWIAICVVMFVNISGEVAPLLVMGMLALGSISSFLWCGNYVCIEHNRMIIRHIVPYFNREIYFSDMEKTEINEKSLMTVTMKSGGKKIKRYLGLLTPSMLEALKARLKLES